MKQFSPDFISTLQTLPNSCVYAIISYSTKQCLVSHSNNLQSSIGAILASNKVQGNDVRLVVLDVLEDKEYKLLLCERYKIQYMLDGFFIVNERSYINYSVSIQYSRDLHNTLVVLYNRRRDKKVVGVFDNINEAKSFVEEYYKQGSCTFPVIANNTLTSTYMKKMYDKNSRV